MARLKFCDRMMRSTLASRSAVLLMHAVFLVPSVVAVRYGSAEGCTRQRCAGVRRRRRRAAAGRRQLRRCFLTAGTGSREWHCRSSWPEGRRRRPWSTGTASTAQTRTRRSRGTSTTNHDEAEGGEYIAHSLRFAFALRANRRSSSPGLYLSALYALRAQVWSQPARI